MDIVFKDSLLGKIIQPDGISKENPIKWYMCGPTIYDSAHIGHARTFITFDIIRRIMNYFGYTVFTTMNLTDIDDKIINKVNEKYDPTTGISKEDYYYQFIKEMEWDFWEDLDQLGVDRPYVVTRVSQYIDKIKQFIQKIIDNGYGYISNGSVYFDSQKFVGDGYQLYHFHKFDKFEESDFVSEKSEGFLGEKKNKADFALWKAAKPDEIKFKSDWGYGRPGWHIECSTMATDIFGTTFDIHAGGIDLIFPHHNNEIVQADAYVNNKLKDSKWVKYFLHSGHLNINGEKMAKSLKNFITIKQYLESIGTARQLRLLFLIHKWDKTMDYCSDTVNEAKHIEKRLEDLLKHLKFVINEVNSTNKMVDLTTASEYQKYFMMFKDGVDNDLSDNFNTAGAFDRIMVFITDIYKYLDKDYCMELIKDTYRYFIELFGMLGLQFEQISQLDGGKLRDITKLGINLREDIRNIVVQNKKGIDKSVLGDMFKILDDFRDNKLPEAGIQLVDASSNDGNNSEFHFNF